MIFSLLLQVGCSSSSYIRIEQYSEKYRNDITGVVLNNETEYDLGRAYNIKADTLYIFNYESYQETGVFERNIPFNDISKFRFERFDTGKTVLLIAGVLVVVLVVAALNVDMDLGFKMKRL